MFYCSSEIFLSKNRLMLWNLTPWGEASTRSHCSLRFRDGLRLPAPARRIHQSLISPGPVHGASPLRERALLDFDKLGVVRPQLLPGRLACRAEAAGLEGPTVSPATAPAYTLLSQSHLRCLRPEISAALSVEQTFWNFWTFTPKGGVGNSGECGGQLFKGRVLDIHQ